MCLWFQTTLVQLGRNKSAGGRKTVKPCFSNKWMFLKVQINPPRAFKHPPKTLGLTPALSYCDEVIATWQQAASGLVHMYADISRGFFGSGHTNNALK